MRRNFGPTQLAPELGPHLLRVLGVGADRDRERAILAQRLAHDLGMAVKPAHARAVGHVEDEVERDTPRSQPRLDLGCEPVEPLPAQRRDQNRMPLGGLTFGEIADAPAGLPIEPVDLVPDLDQPRTVLRRNAELARPLRRRAIALGYP